MLDRRLPFNGRRSSGLAETTPVNQEPSLNANQDAAALAHDSGTTPEPASSIVQRPGLRLTPGSSPNLSGKAVTYVANSEDSSVSVIDMSNFSKLMDINVASGPVALDLSPNGGSLYVVSRDGTLTIINTRGNSISGTVKLPATPASSPVGVKTSFDNGFVYVIYDNTPYITIVNPALQQVVGSIPLSDVAAAGIDITKDGRCAYVTLSTLSQVAVADLKVSRVVKIITNVISPGQITIWKSRNLAYASNTTANTVTVLNTELAQASNDTIPAPGNPAGMVFSPTSGKAYVSLSASDAIQSVDIFTSTPLLSIPVGQSEPKGLDITFDERFLVVANSKSGSASLINTATNKVEKSISTGAGASVVLIYDPERIGFRNMI